MRIKTLFFALSLAGTVSLPPNANADSASQDRQIACVPTSTLSLSDYRQSALATFRSERFAEACKQYQAICQMPDASGQDFYWLGEAWAHAGNRLNAVLAFERATMTSPRVEIAYAKLAENYIALHQPDKARAACIQGLSTTLDAHLRAQLEVLSKVASKPMPTFKRHDSNFQAPARRAANG